MIKKGKRVSASQSVWVIHKPSNSDLAVIEFATVELTYKVSASFRNSQTANIFVLRSDTRSWNFHERSFFRNLNRPVRRMALSASFYTKHNKALEALEKFNHPVLVENRKNAREKFAELLKGGLKFSTRDLTIDGDKIVPSNERIFRLTVNPDGSKTLEETEVPKRNNPVERSVSSGESPLESNGDSGRFPGELPR